ncbi:helix-turn-helix transcriptional regulator [Nonomuraea sp. NPDC050783]|uniref:helix-turn-helix transcriptional regulator n=1 Tax=Nonomuraea sp. NPDC050783 TaxID=3154634 RepID=UPI0034661B18
MSREDPAERDPAWIFVTNHTRVLVVLATDPRARIRDIAAAIGITERAVHSIIADLEEAGYVQRVREGRRNSYQVMPDGRLRHPSQSALSVQGLIDLFMGTIVIPGTGRDPGQDDEPPDAPARD